MKHENKIYEILRRFVDGILPVSYRNKVLHWIFGGTDADEKDKALFKLWNEVDTSSVSSSQIQASLHDVKTRLGIYTVSNAASINDKNIYRINQSFLKYAAIFLLPIISGLAVWFVMNSNSRNTPQMLECFVPNGEKKTISLSDGTKVILNSGTLFIYPEQFADNERNVYLSGEASFDVAHNGTSPFIVRTGRLNVKVLGTHFNLEAYPDEKVISTTLNKGSVKVYHPEQEENGIVLEPDERLVYHAEDNKFNLFKVDSEDYSKWTEGEMRFIRQPLYSVLKTLGRRYDVEFRYDNKINLDELYTISFKSNETVEQVVHVLTSIIDKDMKTSISGDTIYLYGSGKGGKRK